MTDHDSTPTRTPVGWSGGRDLRNSLAAGIRQVILSANDWASRRVVRLTENALLMTTTPLARLRFASHEFSARHRAELIFAKPECCRSFGAHDLLVQRRGSSEGARRAKTPSQTPVAPRGAPGDPNRTSAQGH